MALILDSSGEKLTTPAFVIPTQVTFAAWVMNPPLANGGPRIFENATPTTRFFFGSPGDLIFQRLWNVTAQWTVSFATLGVADLTGWHHVAVTYDGSSTANDPIFYFDGQVVAHTENTAPSGTINATSTVMTIGNRPANAREIGTFDHVGIYNAVLSQANIQSLLTNAHFASNQYANWSFDSLAATYTDLSGNGRTATVVGTLAHTAGPSFTVPFGTGSPIFEDNFEGGNKALNTDEDWSSGVYSGGSLSTVSGKLTNSSQGTFQSNYTNITTYGNGDYGITISTLPAVGESLTFIVCGQHFVEAGGTDIIGYPLIIGRTSGGHWAEFYEADGTTWNFIDGIYNQSWSDGDTFGIRKNSSALEVYRVTGGVPSVIFSHTDASHSNGRIMVYTDDAAPKIEQIYHRTLTAQTTFSPTDSDRGTGTEGRSLARASTRTDTGSGTDASSLLRHSAIPVTELGTGNSTSSIVIGSTRTDSGTGTEARTLSRASTRTDSATSSETSNIAGGLASSETGLGTDASSVLREELQADSDSGTGDQTSAVTITASRTELGSGSETATIVVALNDTDSGSGIDGEELARASEGIDSGVGIETSTLEVTANRSDSAIATEDQNLNALTISEEDGSGTDEATYNLALDRSDSASGIENASYISTLSGEDTGSGDETGIVSTDNEKVATDSAIGTETTYVEVIFLRTDGGSSTEGMTSAASVNNSDDGFVTETPLMSNSLTAFEIGNLIEQIDLNEGPEGPTTKMKVNGVFTEVVIRRKVNGVFS